MQKAYVILFLTCAITFVLWALSKESVSQIIDSPFKSLAQISALLGATGYFLSFIFSSRLHFFERVIPLDKSYRIHRIVGALAGVGILTHISGVLMHYSDNPKVFSYYLLPSSNFSYSVGVLAFYLIILMLVSTIYVKLPYHIWKIIHKGTSFSIIFATIHLLVISSDVSLYFPLRYWMLSIAILGVGAWIYKEFIYPRTAFNKVFSIEKVVVKDTILVLTLTQTRQIPLEILPGQFAFFSFIDRTGKVSSEAHPFTVLSSSERVMKIAIKMAGDYTTSLGKLTTGTRVLVDGPYGAFGKAMLNSSKPSVWIAGGIGVVPFINVLDILTHKSTKIGNVLHFFYSTRQQDTLFSPLIEKAAQKLGFFYLYRCTTERGRIDPPFVFKSLPQHCTEYNYFLCGPDEMVNSFITELKNSGVPSSQIFCEEFNFISQTI